MTTTTSLPRSIPAWIKLLDDSPLPAFAAVHDSVRRALRDNSQSMRQIAERVQPSPVLALSFIREANRHGGDGQPAENLETALSRIGVERAERL
ncbi:MAG: HDOD domain-containing protein, partial [Pseudomonadaceae bacterium]